MVWCWGGGEVLGRVSGGWVGNGWHTELFGKSWVEPALGNAVVTKSEEAKAHEAECIEVHASSHIERHVDLVRVRASRCLAPFVLDQGGVTE